MNHTHTTFWPTLFFLALSANCFSQVQFQSIKQIEAGQGYSITPLPGDYDGDGDMDILGTGSYVLNGTSSNATVLLRNDGEKFVAIDIDLPSFYTGGMYQWADLDNDNDLDIIAGGCGSYCYNSKVLSIYRNDGADKFTLITEPTNLIGGKTFNLVDYNNDGLIDIEIATQSDNNGDVIGHTFYKNTGNFIFQETFVLDVISGETVWSDLNNDGWIDFVLWNQAYKNLQDGTFQPFSPTVTMPYSLKHFIIDVDNDGDQDVINSYGSLWKNDGNGQLNYEREIIPYDYIGSLLIADFDGDGNKDMVVSGSKTQLFRSNGDGTFTIEDLNEQYKYSYLLAVADMDNDKDPDILLSGIYVRDIIILENGLATELSKPEAPTNLQTLIETPNITISWDSAIDQEQTSLKYNIYLSHDDLYDIVPNSDTVTGASFIPGVANASLALQKKISISELPDGYFRWSVQSVDDELNTSKFATSKEFTLYTNNPANAPTSLTKFAVDNKSVSLAWTDNSNDETSFTIERSSVNGNSGFELVSQVGSNVIDYTDNTVSSRSVYYYRIRLDGSTSVAYSNVIRVETKANIELAPTNVRTVAVNSASVKVDWEYLGTGITGFVIERSLGDKKHFTELGAVSAGVRAYSDYQLESGRNYYYRLFAVNGEDVSNYSNTSNVSIPLKEFDKFTLSSLAYESRYGMSTIAWGDYDNDGFDDLFLGYKAQLFHNEGDGTFQQITETNITPSESAYNFVAVWGDYNNDGFLDLYYYNNQDKSTLYQGHGNGTFSKIYTIINGDRSDIMNATWTDFDMDGDLDLSMTGGRYVYRYDGNDTFIRLDFPGENPASYYNSSVASWADYDDDGDPDVFIGNNGKDELFINNGDGSFSAITDQRVTVDNNYDCCPSPTPTALWADFNNDSKLDLTILHSDGSIYSYSNNENSFDSVFYSYEYNRGARKNLFWTDYDSDGDIDLFSMGQYNIRTEIWENKEGKPVSRLKGGSLYEYIPSDAAFSWNDYNNDGYNDLFQFDEDHQVYKNLSNGNSWIKIRLKGRSSNSTGLGAKIFVKSNAHWQRSDVTTHHSFQVQQGFMSLFGLGNAVQVDSVKILWPSGNRQYLTNVDVNQLILIDENDAQEKVMQAPSNLTAQVVYPSSIILNWTDRSDNETGFVIETMTEGGQFEEIETVGANVNSVNINELTIGVKYKFRVRTSPSPNGKWTNIVEAQIRLFTEVFAGDLTSFGSEPEGLAWGDPDGDGDPDLFVGSESFEPDAIYYNENGFFTRTYLRNTSNYSRQAQWVDYDNDGYQDLHISVGGGIIASPERLNDFLYKNDGSGKMIEQVDHILSMDSYSDYTAVWGDLNKNGYLDMIAPRPNNAPTVYLNQEGNMVQQEESFGLIVQENALLSDLDNDRDLDVISTGSYNSSSYVYENNNGQFMAIANTGLPSSFYSFVLEDFDNDGDFDMVLIDQDQKLRLYLFDPDSLMFKERINVFPSISQVLKLSAGDLDNNGFMDVFVTGEVSSNSNKIFLNNENLQFASLTDPILERNLQGAASADVNKDGHLDLITYASDNYYETKTYLLQGSKNENHWLRVKLKGIEDNKFGIGGRIRLFTGNTSQVRDIRSGSSGTFSDEQVAHFGIGTKTAIDYIKVEWPSGEDQWIANPSIDKEMIVEQASTPGPDSPASPSDLVATYQVTGYIDLQWADNNDNENQFRIERAIGTDAFSHFRNLPANTISYTDSTFMDYSENHLDVKYRVIAIAYFSVESTPSNEASISIVTGIKEEAIESLNIYPQPASSKVTVRSKHKIRSITLMSVEGEIIKKVSVSGLQEVEVPLNRLATGVYLIRIIDNKESHLRKIIVVTDN